MEKKGLSAVVGTILIILLVIVAVGIIWAVASGLFKGGAEELSTGFLIDMDIKSATIDGSIVSISVKRNVGAGTLSGIKFVFSDGESTKGEEKTTSMDELDQESFSFDIVDLGIPDAYDVSIAPIYKSESGEDILRNIVDRAEFREAGDSEPPGGGGVCGDGNVDVGEDCDGENLNGKTCETQGYLTGTLSCAGDCTFDTSDCSDSGGNCTDGETSLCVKQDGVCEGSEQICAGSTWPGCDAATYFAHNSLYEDGTELSCTGGEDNDCDGTTDYEDTDCELTHIGHVGTPWPTETKILFDIVENTSEFVTPTENYVGMYMSFSGTSVETRCIQIYDYILPTETPLYDKAIARLNENVDLPINITGGDTFTIWETSTTCT